MMQSIFFIFWIFYPNKMNNELEKRIKNLKDKKREVDNRARKALETIEDIPELVDEWLDDVPRILEESEDLLEQAKTMCEGSLLERMIWKSLVHGYQVFVKAMDMIKKLDSLVDDWNFDKIITTMPRNDVLVKQILDDLQKEKVSVSGLFGVGGVGKTTILEKLMVEAKKRGVFNVVAKAVVSEIVNEERIQEEIAQGIGLSFEAEDTDVKTRSDKLRNTLEIALHEKKILIIFDNVWTSKLDIYGSIGIPKGSKIVLSSRSKDVCDQMGAISYKVEPLDQDESKVLYHKLLKSSYGSTLKSENLTDLEKLVDKCGGLPLALETVSLVVPYQLREHGEPSTCEWIADVMSGSVGSHLGEDPMVSKVVKASFETIRLSVELVLFLELCCLFPGDSAICVEEIMRYGMGLDWFFHCETMDKCISQVNNWAQDLRDLNLLLFVKDENNQGLLIKMHDSTRNIVINEILPDIEEFCVMTDSNERKWSDGNTNETYGISVLLSVQGVHKLHERKCDRLQVLRLECCSFKSNFHFDEECFSDMPSLKVLEIRNSNFWKLQPHLGSLKSLVTLCLHNCYKVDNLMEMISNLYNLEVLSLRGSDISEILGDIGELTRLKVLDITRCKKLQKFCPEVIRKLSESLEGLYMLGSLSRLNSEEFLTIVELLNDCSEHPALKVLQMEIKDDEQCIDNEFPPVESTTCFAIKIGSGQHSFFLDQIVNGSLINPCFGSTRKVLELHGFKGASEVIRSSLGSLLKEVKELQLYKLENITETITHLGVGDNLTKLFIDSCSEMEYVISDKNSLLKLTHLYLINLRKLVGICSSEEFSFGKAFSELKVLHIHGCPKMEYLSSEFPQNLESLDISYCSSLESVFRTRAVEGVEDQNFQLPKLQFLRIWGAHKLRSFFSYADTNEHTKIPPFFCQKVRLPEIKDLVIGRVQLRDIWDKEEPTEYLTKLESLQISLCIGINIVIPFPLMSNLNKLTKMEICHCYKIEEIFPNGDIDPSTSTSSDEPSKLIQLRKIALKNLYRLTRINLSYYVVQRLTHISVEGCPNLEFLFPASLVKTMKQLKQLDIENCKELVTIVVGGIENEEVELPRLQKIQFRTLNSLESFYSGSCCLKLIDLESLEIVDCSVLNRFCSTPMTKMDTPKLTHVKLSNETQNLNDDLNTTIKHLFKHKYLANRRENELSPDEIQQIKNSIKEVDTEIKNIKEELKDPDRGRCIYSDPDERKMYIGTINQLLCTINANEGKHSSLRQEQQSAIKELEALRSDIDS